jgi:hypothetical protein
MTLTKIAGVALTVATLALSVPAFAGGTNQSTGRLGGGDGQNSLAGNTAGGGVGDNPNITDPEYSCSTIRGYGPSAKCPNGHPRMQSLPVPREYRAPYGYRY